MRGGLQYDSARRPGGGGGVRRKGLSHAADGTGEAEGVLPCAFHSRGVYFGYGPSRWDRAAGL